MAVPRYRTGNLQGLVKDEICGKVREKRFYFWLEGSESEDRKNSRPGRAEGH